jgi:AraC-like DNA-binding protein
MLVDLKLRKEYGGLLYLAESSLPSIQSHQHRELELNLVVQGSITYVVNGNRYSITPRTLLWLFPGQEHQLIAKTDDVRFYVVVFTPSLIRKSCHVEKYEGLKRLPNDGKGILSVVLSPRSFDLISKVMESLLKDSLDADLLNREAGFGPASEFRFEHYDPDSLNAGLQYLLLLCWRYQGEGRAGGVPVALHPAVRRALRLLSEKDNGEDLQELAERCYVSKAYLSRIFHRQIGVPLTQYRNSLRLSRFFEAYGGPERNTLTDAMYSAGFGSYSQFYKVFQRAYGVGPRECLTRKPS